MGSGKFGDTNPAKDSLQAAGQWMEKPLVEIPGLGADFMKKHPYLERVLHFFLLVQREREARSQKSWVFATVLGLFSSENASKS